MPQVNVFISEADLEQIVKELLSADCLLIPDVLSAQRKMNEIDSISKFRMWRMQKKTALFFAISVDWKVAPFVWSKVQKDGHTKYFIWQKTGGPTLDIFAPIPFVNREGRNILPHGFIGYHSTFWNPLTNQTEKPPEALKAMYKKILQKLYLDGEKINAEKRNYLIAHGAKQLLDGGCCLGSPIDKTSKKFSSP